MKEVFCFWHNKVGDGRVVECHLTELGKAMNRSGSRLTMCYYFSYETADGSP